MPRDLNKKREYQSAYYAKNREKILARAKRYHEENYAPNREIILIRNKTWREANREKTSAYKKVYRAANPEKLTAQGTVYARHRRAANPGVRLIENLRRRVYAAVKKGYKSARTKELLGCTIPELRAHIESQFRPGMTWENYGPVWHIDHRRPCASFNLLDADQQRACFHYSNLQPLFAQENLRKGDKYEQLSQ